MKETFIASPVLAVDMLVLSMMGSRVMYNAVDLVLPMYASQETCRVQIAVLCNGLTLQRELLKN